MSELELARVEAVFREVNEAIARTAERYNEKAAEFVCECGDPDCAERVVVPLNAYEEVRADGARFIVADGHEIDEVERVLRKLPEYTVVLKIGKSLAAAVKRLNPRRPPQVQPSE
ncbi:MAG TPA: hypothetical protein VGH52_04180 [Gaiellaceae bacterium]|jgi:hypothetical protein